MKLPSSKRLKADSFPVCSLLLMALVLVLGFVCRSPVNSLDLAVYDFFKPLAQSALWISFFSAVTWLGDDKILVLLFLPIPLLCFQKRWKTEGIFYLAGILICRILIRFLKWFFMRPRPEPFEGVALPHSFSYPSGHAFGALILFVILVWVLSRLFSLKHERLWTALAVGLALLVGLSRLALGVHWFTDVVGGFLLAGALLLLHHALAKKYSFFGHPN